MPILKINFHMCVLSNAICNIDIVFFFDIITNPTNLYLKFNSAFLLSLFLFVRDICIYTCKIPLTHNSLI